MHVQSGCFAHVTYSFLFLFFFFFHVLVVVASLDLKVPNVQWANNSSRYALRFLVNFPQLRRRGNEQILRWLENGGKAMTLLYISIVPTYIPYFPPNWVTSYKGERVRKEAKSIFHRGFQWRRLCRIVSRSLFLCHGSLWNHSFLLTECYWAARGQPTSFWWHAQRRRARRSECFRRLVSRPFIVNELSVAGFF